MLSRSAMRSRAFAVPAATRLVRRSRSRMDPSWSARRIRRPAFAASSPTAWWRSLMAVASSKGCSSHWRSLRPPMAVRVSSSTESSEPFQDPSRAVWVSSRLRRVAGSSCMYSARR
ncbi:hypothetical protein D3C86_1556760 [compost metagenome]